MPDDETTPDTKQSAGGRRTSSRSGRGRRTAKGPAEETPAAQPSGGTRDGAATAGALAAALRDLVSGIEHEVAEVSRLSEVIDDHVVTLNALRADVAQRLLHLDELRAAAQDANLGAFLDDTIQPQLPQQSEDFPDRIYGT